MQNNYNHTERSDEYSSAIKKLLTWGDVDDNNGITKRATFVVSNHVSAT